MNQQMPRTPFSTHLSGSARETEIRLRNIFSGPKKRPPLPFLILMFAIAIFCGNLVSCRQRPPEPSLVMETQYYDRNDNYIEIPALALPAGEENDAVDAINAALNDLRSQYGDLLDNSYGFVEEQCLFYPSTTDRYLNLLFYRDTFTSDLNTGHIFSLVYDLKEGTLVPAEDALALAGLNEKSLLDQVTEQVLTQIARDTQGDDLRLALYGLTIEGFRIKANGQPVFYLTGRIDDVDDAVRDDVSGADYLYIWEDRAVTTYDQYSGKPSPLVPAEETDRLDPPLWNQWYFAGEEPVGGFVPVDTPSPEPYDPEVCLYRDGFTTPVGPGNWVDSMFQDFEPETSVFEEGDPIYWPGDYWENWSVDGGGDAGGVSALRYYSADSGSFSLNRMETGRADMVTPRGIRVGATREEVLAAYPGLLSDEKDWTWAYPDDYLWYCANEDGIGPHLYFYFVNDVVYMIQMVDLFN